MNDPDRVPASDVGPTDVSADVPGRPPGRPIDPSEGRRWTVSVFGDITRRGSWPSRGRLSPVAVFGDIDLDFRNATAAGGEVVITAVAPFGDIEVLVPDGVRVDVGGFTLFGSKRIEVGDGTAIDDRPTIRVRGFTIFGSLKVRS